MKNKLILLLLLCQTLVWAEVDITPIEQICSPSNYKTGTAYWEALLEYKLVNGSDKQAKKVILNNSDYANLVKVAYHTVNLFGTPNEEVVVQFTFDQQSSYIHCFYHTQGDWYKTEHSLEYIDADQVASRRVIQLSFKELYNEGQFVLLIEKTSQNNQINHTTTWLSVWQASPSSLKMLLTEKIRMNSINEEYKAELEWSATLPAVLLLKGKKTTYLELVKEIENDTIIEEWVEYSTIEKKCAFEKGKPCQWEILAENVSSKREEY